MDLVALRKAVTVACSRNASIAIFAFSPASIRRLVFFVIVRSVYQTERLFSNLTSGPKNGVHFSLRVVQPRCFRRWRAGTKTTP